MEDKSKRPSSIGTIGFMIAAILFAAIAGMLLSNVMESTYSQEPVKPIVVAARNIPASQLLNKEDLKVASWPQSSIPAGAFEKIEDVVDKGRVPLIPLVPGEPVLVSHLSKPNAGMGIAPLVDPNRRAMAITTDNPVTLSRLLYPGALVDVLSTMRDTLANTQDGRPRVSSKIVLQAVKVLSVGEDIDPLTITRRQRDLQQKQAEGGTSAMGGEEPDSREKRAVVTLLVTPEEAERLTLARREGDIDLILRNPKDTRVIDTPGATPTAFLPLDDESALLLEGLSRAPSLSTADPSGAGSASARNRNTRRRKGDDGDSGGRSSPVRESPGVVIIK